MQDGRTAREGDLPSAIERDPETGVVVQEEYHLKGLLHRRDGPAAIARDRVSGNVVSQEFYIDGHKVTADGQDPTPSP